MWRRQFRFVGSSAKALIRFCFAMRGKEVDRMMKGAFLLLGLTALAGPGSTEERVWRLGVLTPLDWRASSTNSILLAPGHDAFLELLSWLKEQLRRTIRDK